jgi:hypothetical protein
MSICEFRHHRLNVTMDKATVVGEGWRAQLEISPFRSKALLGHSNTCVALAHMGKSAERFGVVFLRDEHPMER